MRVLALDTTARALSAALVEDGRVVVERVGDAARSHAERLPGDLLAVIAEAGLALSAIDLFAVAAGPGSFTGLRIGIATVQGLAFVTGTRIVPVSALDALGQAAAETEAEGSLVAAWIDAHRGDVFSALFRVAAAPPFEPARLIEVDGPAVGDPAGTLARWQAAGLAPAACIGSGAGRYAAILAREVPRGRLVPAPPLAGVVGRMAIARGRAGEAVDPAGVQPVYVRRPDAVLAREQRARQGAPQ